MNQLLPLALVLWLLAQSGPSAPAPARARAPSPPPARPAPAPAPAPARAPARAPAPRPRVLTSRDRANLGVAAESATQAILIASKAIQDAAVAAGLDRTTALPHPLQARRTRVGRYLVTGDLELVQADGSPPSSEQLAAFRRALGRAAHVTVR